MVTNYQISHPWYQNNYVLFEMCKYLKWRYMSILRRDQEKPKLIRYLMGYNTDLLVSGTERFGGFNFNSKFYYDLSTWKETPKISYAGGKTRDYDKDSFNDNWENNISGYDFALDLDGKTPLEAYKDAKIIKGLFDHNKIPYSVRFSGSQGFHFVIPFEFFSKRLKLTSLPQKFGGVAGWIKERYRLSTVDMTIYDHRRILKLPYSCDKGNVVLPLSDLQFDGFRPEMVEMRNVLRDVRVYDRGDLLRLHGQERSGKVLCVGVDKLVKGDLEIPERMLKK